MVASGDARMHRFLLSPSSRSDGGTVRDDLPDREAHFRDRADTEMGEEAEPTHRRALTYSAAEAAELLGVDEWWLTNEAKAGRVPHVKLGRARRFTQLHLDEILRAAEQKPAEPRMPTPAYGLSPRSARYHSK